MDKVIAKVVVLNTQGQVLLLRRSATDDRRAGEWDFPGGQVERGESYVAGAARELREEAGISRSEDQFMLLYCGSQYYEQDHVSVSRMLYTTRLQENVQIKLSFEHDEFAWVPREQAVKDFPHPLYGVGLQYAIANNLLP